MQKKSIINLAVFVIATSVFAGNPGGEAGFVKAIFTGSKCDITSDVFANATAWVFAPEEMYATSLAEKTTVAYGTYMHMEAGVQYNFKGCYDDFVTVKIGSTWVLSKGYECKERTGSYTPAATDWYKIDLRVANNTSNGGCRTDSQYGILWKKSSESVWHKFTADGDLFMTGEIPSSLKNAGKPLVSLISAKMRETDPTIMDVQYRVLSTSDKVNVRALAFQDGVRSFANVVRPTTFLEGSQIGDGVPANTVNSFAWRVSDDWKVDLAKVSIEILAQDVEAGLISLDFVTIPAHGGYEDISCSTNIVTDAEFLDALYWLYANGDSELTLKDGWLRDSKEEILVKGDTLQGNGFVAEFIYNKMGLHAVGTNGKWPYAVLAAIERARRVSMPYSGNHRYAIKGSPISATQAIGDGLYMVIDLNSNDFNFPVTYLNATPTKWGDEYKTNKIVLRRIDDPNGTYYAGVFEITEAQWAKVMGGSSTSVKPKACISYMDIRGDFNVYNWPTTDEVASDSFIGALRQMTGISTFDLPSEKEWEFAARAGVTTKWLCGDTEAGLENYAWYSVNSDGVTHEVGSRLPNAWGLYDVHGNVREWCLDINFDTWRTVRGGAYNNNATRCALSYSTCSRPHNEADISDGFRLFCRSKSK